MANTAAQQTIVDEAMSGKAASKLSPDALYYRSYGKFSTPEQNATQTKLSAVAPGYVADTNDYGAGSPAGLVGGESNKTANYQPLEAGRQTMKEQLDAGTLGKPGTPDAPVGPTQPIDQGQTGINTNQPSPTTVNATPFTGNSGDVLSGGSGQGSGQTPVPSKFEQGFKQANAAIGSGAAGGLSNTQGSALVQAYSPAKTNDASSLIVSTDPYLDTLAKMAQDYLSPQNQRVSLTDTYNQMLKDSGIQAIDMQLINTKNVIDGTEDDIRNEITKAGGFASESQVLALTNSRNKQLIKNYNTLLDTRDAKEKYLQTAIQLEQQDRQAADQKFNQAFNMATQLSTLHMQMQQNARQQMQWVAGQIGMDGLLKSTGGDPYYQSMVEQTLGLPKGGLTSAAQQASQARLKADQAQQLDLQMKQEQIKTSQAQRAKIASDMGKVDTQVVDVNGRKYLVNSNTGATIKEISPGTTTVQSQQQMAVNQAQIQQIGNILADKTLNKVVGPNALSRIPAAPSGLFGRIGDTLTGGFVRRLSNPGASNTIADIEQLRQSLTLQNLQSAKANGATFGALSEGELNLLSSSASKLGTWAIKDKNGNIVGYNAKESDFKNELDKINNFAKLDYILKGGNPADVGVTILPDGSHAVVNSNGSVTKF